MMPEPPSLSSANAELGRLLSRLEDPTRSSIGLAEDMAGLSLALHRAAVSVHGVTQAVEDLAEYKRILKQLQAVLPRIHSRLVLESDRMRDARGHREATAAWISASRITF